MTSAPSPMGRLADPRVRLVLTSATLLFVELLLIRWIPSTVRYIGFFSNFLLMASFLGIGLGILLGRRIQLGVMAAFPVLLAVVVWLVSNLELNIQVRSTNELFFGLAESKAADLNFLVLPLVFALITALMAGLALPLGPLLKSRPPLEAYAFDIAGSLLGIAAFTILSAAGTPPIVWFSVAAILVIALTAGAGLRIGTLVAAASFAVILVFAWRNGVKNPTEIWSPYYRIDTYQNSAGQMTINVNGIPHQTIHAVNGPQESFYTQIYRWFPDRTYQNVLIVGAGSGTDTAIALAHGAGHVDAVEIDREIQRLGREHDPDQPYQDPRVRAIENDGRAFLRSTDTKYDLIVFALPDSLTLVSSQANIRLESFLFTNEAFQSVRDHLAPGGVFVLYNYYREEWLVGKIATMLQDAFGTTPVLRLTANTQAVLADGPMIAALSGANPPGDQVDAIPATGDPQPKAATDDWPFLYLRTPFIADYYLAGLAFVLVFAAISVMLGARATGTAIRRFSPHFFVLGSAFLLLETRSLVSFSLLFGSTWLVNALAFFAILLSVLLAIFVNARLRIQRPAPLYGLLFVAIAVAFLLPPESLLLDPPWLRYVLAAGVAFAPVFVANLVFTYSFRDTRTADMAFASNLLGAMVGGAMEYVALLTGYRALLIIVAILYALAWLFANRWRLLADRDLAPDDGLAITETAEAAL
ncbi:MAG: spermidine synthase [Chloroflexi bacterium]|nr:spermidine synthase [Chloroflexota bacterium]